MFCSLLFSVIFASIILKDQGTAGGCILTSCEGYIK